MVVKDLKMKEWWRYLESALFSVEDREGFLSVVHHLEVKDHRHMLFPRELDECKSARMRQFDEVKTRQARTHACQWQIVIVDSDMAVDGFIFSDVDVRG